MNLRMSAALAVAILLLGWLGPALAAPVALPGPTGAEGDLLRQQLWLVPSPVKGLLMHSYLYRPAGNGPFPLAVINHGSEDDAGQRAAMGMPAFPALTAWPFF